VPADRPVTPRQAATVILLRGGAERLEVLLVRRNPQARFMGGAWVFPGGAVDAGETHRAAGVREVAEEAAVLLPDPDALVELSRWITPATLPMRFDTLFFLAAAPADAEPRVDGAECVDAGWFAPRTALAGGISLMLPTRRTLEQLDGFASADAVLSWAAGREPETYTP
jgi:8-oxo-dGTP pyrophosphatase MutT (NUDIX family)